jgi:hypothetical protein
MKDLIRKDGYINATKLCKAGGKKFGNWFENKTTKLYIKKVSEYLNKPVKEIIIIKRGGDCKKQGTWVHILIATHIAQWISTDFSFKIAKWIEEWKDINNNKEIYHKELKSLESDNIKDDKEKKIQLKLLKELKGQIEVETECGFIDLLTDTELIEIKDGILWKHGVGQLIVYSEYYPNHQKRLHLFDMINDSKINKICIKNNIIVTYE